MPYRDEFDDPQADRNITQTMEAVRRQVFLKTRGPAVAGGILFVAALILAAVIFFTYPGEQDPDMIPVIQADARPFKVIPDDPGGMAIPHRDSTVFSSMRSSGIAEDSGVENLFDDAETEEPMPRSQLFAGLNMEEGELNEIDPDAGTEELLNEGVAETESLFGEMKEEASGDFAATRETIEQSPNAIEETFEKVELIEPKPTIEEPKIAAAPVVEEKPAPKPAPKAEPKPQQVAALTEAPKTDMVTGSASGTHYVQIGAVKSAAAAAAGWGTYQNEYSPILSNADHRVQRADLGDKGIYFRIQAGPFSKAKASEVCSAIKLQKPGGCLIVAK